MVTGKLPVTFSTSPSVLLSVPIRTSASALVVAKEQLRIVTLETVAVVPAGISEAPASEAPPRAVTLIAAFLPHSSVK